MPLLPSCKDKEIAYYAHSLISLLIMFGCGQLTPITPLTPLGMNLIGIFLGVLYGWIFISSGRAWRACWRSCSSAA